jgi:Fur family transcriptional regulator, peroxide stress response regulator
LFLKENDSYIEILRHEYMKYEEIKNILLQNKLKITPQRVAVLEAVTELRNHPTTDFIIDFIKQNHPSIAIGTVYKILETYVEKGIVKRVKTDKDILHYDAILENHHHLYCSESDRIEDYYDKELDDILKDYFEKKNISGFKIEDVKLQINGKFRNKKQK